jgi:hypothetical protein
VSVLGISHCLGVVVMTIGPGASDGALGFRCYGSTWG